MRATVLDNKEITFLTEQEVQSISGCSRIRARFYFSVSLTFVVLLKLTPLMAENEPFLPLSFSKSGDTFPRSPPKRLALMVQRPEFCHPTPPSANCWQVEWDQHDWLKPIKTHPLPHGHAKEVAYLSKNEVLAGGGKQSKEVVYGNRYCIDDQECQLQS